MYCDLLQCGYGRMNLARYTMPRPTSLCISKTLPATTGMVCGGYERHLVVIMLTKCFTSQALLNEYTFQTIMPSDM